MNRLDIIKCNDIEKLRHACLNLYKQSFYVGEILVEESKNHINSTVACQKMRDYLCKTDYQTDFDSYLTNREEFELLNDWINLEVVLIGDNWGDQQWDVIECVKRGMMAERYDKPHHFAFDEQNVPGWEFGIRLGENV